MLRPPLESFFKARPPLEFFLKPKISPIQQKDLVGKRGKDGKTPSTKELLYLISSVMPDVKDGKTPTKKELELIIKPLIPVIPEVSSDTPKDVIEKINKSRGEKIKRTRVEGLDEVEQIARGSSRQIQNFISLGGSRQTAIKSAGTLIGTGINTINFTTATITKVGDGSEINITTGTGTGQVNSVVAGTGISVNSTDPANPIVSATGGFTILAATGTINDSNLVFTFISAPTFLIINAGFYQKTGGSITWSGTTTVTLSSAVGVGGSIFGL